MAFSTVSMRHPNDNNCLHVASFRPLTCPSSLAPSGNYYGDHQPGLPHLFDSPRLKVQRVRLREREKDGKTHS
jgi:hypothetical protein